MKKTILSAFLLAFAVYSHAGTITTDSIKSTILGATVRFNVYLPTAYKTTEAKWPVVYLLHGLTDTYTAWAQKGNMKEIADELIDKNEASPMVIIMPNAGGPDVNNIWNGYFNMPNWSYEDFFFRELMPAVEEKYHCIGDKGHRAIMGLSMGGGGSIGYSLGHPEMFSSCYAMSPWLNSANAHPGPNGEKTKMFYTIEAVHEHSALTFMEQANDSTRASLQSVAWFLDCGDDDGLLGDTFEFYKRLRLARIKAEFRVRDGAHTWEYWQQSLRQALPFASHHFGK